MTDVAAERLEQRAQHKKQVKEGMVDKDETDEDDEATGQSPPEQ